MVQRASVLAARCGVADRVAFAVGDVAALPFGDASFAEVVSTRFEQRGAGIPELATDSPFGGTRTRDIAIRLGPIPLVYRAKLRREPMMAPAEG